MSVEIKTLRLFFALWPDEAVRASLAQLVEALKRTNRARWVKPENLHITLAFLGRVSEDRLPLVSRVADGIVGQSFDLSLDRVECWQKSGIICLSPIRTPETLINLASTLITELSRAGFVMEKRPCRPHLTLARKGHLDCISPQVLDHPIRWDVGSFSLIESQMSRVGSTYLVWNSWNLSRFKAIPGGSYVR